MKKDKIYTIAQNIIETSYESLPTEVISLAKQLIIDNLGVSMCGSAEPGVKELRDIFHIWGGKEESSVWVYGERLPSVNAAQINATMIHASDYDDTHDPSPVHTGVIAIPTSFAIAEMLGGIDGKKVITSIALGVDLLVRMSMACKVSQFDSGWHLTSLHGSFAAAAVAGKLMGLDEEKLVSALGLAYQQTGGNIQCGHDGTLAKRIGPAFSVRNGIMGALMAQQGITGTRNIIEGTHGFFNVYHGGQFDPEILMGNLGEKNYIVDLSFKPYPCVRNSHPPIDATLEIIRKHKVIPDEIDSISVKVAEGAWKSLCDPLEIKRNPRTFVDSQFSIPWAIAVAISHGRVGLDAFTEQSIQEKKILSLSNKVVPEVDKSLNTRGVTPAIVEIKTKEGKIYSERVDHPYGSPENPMTMEAMNEKLKDCASHAGRPAREDNLEKLINRILELENIVNFEQAIRLLDWSN